MGALWNKSESFHCVPSPPLRVSLQDFLFSVSLFSVLINVVFLGLSPCISVFKQKNGIRGDQLAVFSLVRSPVVPAWHTQRPFDTPPPPTIFSVFPFLHCYVSLSFGYARVILFLLCYFKSFHKPFFTPASFSFLSHTVYFLSPSHSRSLSFFCYKFLGGKKKQCNLGHLLCAL